MLALRVLHLDWTFPVWWGPYGGWEEISRYPVPVHEQGAVRLRFYWHSDGPPPTMTNAGPALAGGLPYGGGVHRDSLCLLFLDYLQQLKLTHSKN